jgi:squalene-hopene/tetraprenyl-beta-curcumene cyclase
VKAAWDWIRKNYTVDANPGMSGNGSEHEADGLYYYYLTMARALSAYGEPVITDAQGHPHDWRQELIAKIVSLQQADGSWKGQDRFMESNPIIATSYAAIALQEAMGDLKERPGK